MESYSIMRTMTSCLQNIFWYICFTT